MPDRRRSFRLAADPYLGSLVRDGRKHVLTCRRAGIKSAHIYAVVRISTWTVGVWRRPSDLPLRFADGGRRTRIADSAQGCNRAGHVA